MPFATRARCFAFAAILLLLQFLYDDKGYRFAYGAAFGDTYSVAFFDFDAWGAV